MDILFKNKKLEKQFNEGAMLEKEHGLRRAQKIRVRMAELRSARFLSDLWTPSSRLGRCHELTKGRRHWQLSVDLDHPYRLIFIPAHDPIPVRPEGGLDWAQVTRVTILGVEDTHE